MGPYLGPVKLREGSLTALVETDDTLSAAARRQINCNHSPPLHSPGASSSYKVSWDSAGMQRQTPRLNRSLKNERDVLIDFLLVGTIPTHFT